jgi:hypothetical protein
MVRRQVIGKGKGKKTRLRFPSINGKQITHTFSSRAEAKRYIKSGWLNNWQKRRAKLYDAKTEKRIER